MTTRPDVTRGTRAGDEDSVRVRCLLDPETEIETTLSRVPCRGELVEDGRAQYEVVSVMHHMGVHSPVRATLYLAVVSPIRDTP